MSEILFVILLVGGFLVPTALFGQWWLFGVFMLFFCCFGIVEFLAVKFTGRSISQKFWELKKKNKAAAYIICGGMLMGWLALLWHFLG
jgi:hypothetical protein